jgi:hypothetical protein
MALVFGSIENLIFVWFGGYTYSRISLIDDSSGQPIILWQYFLNDPVNMYKIHIVSSLKASVETGLDMIAIANGATYKQYGKIVMSSTSPYSVNSTDMVVDSTTSMTTN